MSIASLATNAAGVGYTLPKSPSSAPSAQPLTQAAPAVGDPVVKEFMDYAKMSPAEKIRYTYLKAHGLSEDDLKAMRAEDRKAIEAEIQQEIKDSIHRGTATKPGLITDIHV